MKHQAGEARKHVWHETRWEQEHVGDEAREALEQEEHEARGVREHVGHKGTYST